MGRYVICQVEVICCLRLCVLLGEDADQALYSQAAK